MRVYRGVAGIDDALRGAVLTVGNFDGVHRGHQRILRTARALAHVSSSAVVAMTFEPLPLAILRPESAPPRLTPWDEKLTQLQRAGADAVVRLDADWPLLSLSAEDFVREILVKRIHPSYIVEGPNFGFGRGRAGNVETLRALASRGGFQVREVEPYRLELTGDGMVAVSSTLLRRVVAAGRVEDASKCLGRPYALVGQVVHGAGEGRKMGYPTINLEVAEQLIPAEGVYAGWADVAGMHRPAAISVGTRPTLGGGALVVEAFVLEETGDWYASTARLEFIARLRDQRKFASREDLTAQITQDIAKVRALTAREPIA